MKEKSQSRIKLIHNEFVQRMNPSMGGALRFCLVWALAFTLALQAVLPQVVVAREARGRAKVKPAKTAPKAAPAMQAGGSIILYGPRRFDYQPGPARNVYEPFNLAISAPVAGVVRVQNGDGNGASRASGAIIQLNGATLATARTVNLNTGALDIAANLLAANSLSVRVVGAPGAYLTLTFLAKPIIASLSPASATAGSSISILGAYFDDSATSQNIVNFAKTGGGQTAAQVTAATNTQLSVTVPADAATGPVTVQTAAGTATSPVNFTLLATPPAIAGFSPARAPIGASVALTGTALKIGAVTPTVTFAGANNTRLPAFVTSSTATEVVVTVPNAAVTGVIELTNAAGMASTTTQFFVETTQSFEITAAPATATAIQGSAATFVITLTSPQPSFTQLASLSLQGAPAGSTITFTPEQITAGASSTLILRTGASLAPASYPFTIRATAIVDGAQVTHTTQATINVQLAGQTSLTGRVLSTLNEPIMGATASLDGKTATTDASGSFLLTGVNAGQDRPLVVDGRTASAPNRTYPVITEPANVVAGQVNVIPNIYYLPPIDVQNEVTIVPGQDTMATTPRLPGYQMMIPAGANLRNLDGTPVARMSITSLPIDRIPAPLPANVTTAMVLTAQPGGAMSDMPMPVTYQNMMHANPGTRCELYSFDHNNVRWVVYGYGRVSADGRTIVPEVDPSTGKPYGLRDFAWHFVTPPLPPPPDPPPCDSCPCPASAAPVDLATGNKLETITDLSFGGARGGLELKRFYTTTLALSNTVYRFGRTMKDNYDIRLVGAFQNGGTGRLLTPQEVNGRLFSFTQGIGAGGELGFTSSETVGRLGDVLIKKTDGSYEYRAKGGDRMRFDSTGRLTAMLDRNGNTTTLSYGNGNQLTLITDPVGRTIRFDYSGNKIIRATDPLNRVWSYAYDNLDRLITATDPLGYATTYEYDNFGRLISITGKRGIKVKQISYDADSRVTQQVFADGGIERYEFVTSGTVITSATMTDPLGRKKSLRLNAANYVIGQVDELGQSSEIERDLMTNLPLKTTGPCGCPETTRGFDPRGNLTATTNRLGHTTIYEYEPVFNQVSRMTDRLGRVTNYAYNARGNLIAVTNALNQTMSYAYDPFGQLVSMTDALGHTTQYEYDPNGNLIAIADALNNRWTREYDTISRLTATIDPLGRRSEFSQDSLDRIVTTKDSNNAVTRFTYDGNGNRTRATNALNQQWEHNYDSKNRLVARIDPLNRTTRFEYDANDQLIRTTLPSKRKISYAYDARGQRNMIIDGTGSQIHFTYDNRGNLKTLTDQRNFVMTFLYDELFRLIEQIDPLGRNSSFGYDPEGNVIAMIDRLGRNTSIAYDALNRRERAIYADAVVDYTYDAAGRMTRVNDTQGGVIDLSYDNCNRLLSEQTPQGVVSYTYDQASLRASMTVANAPVVTYSYDPAGRLRGITQGNESFTYIYDTLSRLQNIQRPNGIVTTFQYDVVDRLVRMTHASSLATIEDFQYMYNANEEIESIISLSSEALLTAPKTAAVADAVNRISQFGQADYSFDNLGQTVTRTDSQGVANYNWDARGRLASATISGGQTVSYSYDAVGRRKSRTVGGITTTFLYDGMDVVRDTIGDTFVVDYLNGPGVDQKLRQIGASGNVYFLLDHVGSTIALASASGGVIERAQYEAFGLSNSSTLTSYGFTGREREPLTGLIYYRSRWYDAQQGRFATEDPIGIEGGINLYSYVGNNPVSFIDPLGRARIGSRPLDSSKIPSWANGRGPVRHDQIFYDDGTNSGFFDNDEIRPDRGHSNDDYDFTRNPNHYDDDLMREAERNVQQNWDVDWRMPWWNPLDWNNCQDYVETVRQEYERLREERERQERERRERERRERERRERERRERERRERCP
ncbi:MAG: RHS repeat-associated core domain-containing protein [Blastocatellia bacterium]